MSLHDWAKFGWLKPHETDVRELSNLLAIADRDIADAAASELSNDWRFGIAYNAALKLCTMMLYDAGYMPEKNLAHYRTLLSIEFTLGESRKEDAAYLDSCRAKRNHVHIHLVTNSVSYEDGKKLHQTKKDLQKAKDYVNDMCRQRGLTIAEKGKHFDGSDIEQV